jgi:hypothetical protein
VNDDVFVNLSELRNECEPFGSRSMGAADVLQLRSACIRALVGDKPRSSVAISFRYLGPSQKEEPLASGELRRQIGLKLRAHDTCNVIYVMWHVVPDSGVHVSVKSNPGLTDHASCGDRGYINLPSLAARVPIVRPGEPHTLSARVDGQRLRVFADGDVAWDGILPSAAFAVDGPVGIRSDNGDFDVELRASPELALR